MFKKIITILVFAVALGLTVTGYGCGENKEDSTQTETKSVSKDENKVYRYSENYSDSSKPQLENRVKIAKTDRKSLLSGYNGEEEPERPSGPHIDAVVISVTSPEPASDICVPGYCDKDEEYLSKIDFSRESEDVTCYNHTDCGGLCGSDVEYCRKKLANKCEEESLCASGEFKRAFGVKWCPKEGYVESVQVDDGMLKEGYIEALCVTDRPVEGYIERVGAYGRSTEGYIENVGAYSRGPEGIIESTGSYSRGPEGYIETTGAYGRGPEGYIESVGAKNRGSEGYIEKLNPAGHGVEGYLESVDPGDRGPEGYIENTKVSRGKEGFIESTGASAREPEGYIERTGSYTRDEEDFLSIFGGMFAGFFNEYPTYTEALGITGHGQEGYIEIVDGVRREEGYLENVLGYCYNPEGYIENLGIVGRCVEGYIERVLMGVC